MLALLGPVLALSVLMRTLRSLAALVVSLACASSAASCGQEPETDPETLRETSANDSAATAESTDDLGEAESTLAELGGSTMDGSGNPVLLARCLNLARASVSEKEEFCRSLPDLGVRARCWTYRYNNLQWTGWCFFEFSD